MTLAVYVPTGTAPGRAVRLPERRVTRSTSPTTSTRPMGWADAASARFRGTGASARAGAVRIVGDTIADVGSEVGPAPGDSVIDGRGLVLAPG